jgi:hypothetical protein
MQRFPRVHLLIALLFLANPAAGLACSYGDLPDSDEELFASASTVFLARVVRTEEVKGLSPSMPTMVEATFRVVEIFKGQPPRDGKVSSGRLEEANCSADLRAAQDYVFFLGEDGQVSGLTARRLNHPDWPPDRALLERLRKLARDAR